MSQRDPMDDIPLGVDERCPACGSDTLVPVLYGYPDPATVEAWERGEVELGGCVLPDELVDRVCKRCSHEWSLPRS